MLCYVMLCCHGAFRHILYVLALPVRLRNSFHQFSPNNNTYHGISKGDVDTVLFLYPGIEKKVNKFHNCFFFQALPT